MELLIHVAIALSSVAHATYVLVSPSKSNLRVSYVLVALTLISGSYLVVINPATLIQACVSGLIYVGIIISGLTFAHSRLALQTNRTE